jgi:hypothetical protein
LLGKKSSKLFLLKIAAISPNGRYFAANSIHSIGRRLAYTTAAGAAYIYNLKDLKAVFRNGMQKIWRKQFHPFTA